MANATHIENQGGYDWMASKLRGIAPESILDIGCGTGEGIGALLCRYRCKIVSIDENKDCVRAARDRLQAEGHNVTICERIRFQAMDTKIHRIRLEGGKLNANHQVSLIEGDWLSDNDNELFEFLNTLPKFDAVTVWLAGSHNVRTECEEIRPKMTPMTLLQYRLLVQNRAYEVADKVLRHGGLLHIVDRGRPVDDENRPAHFRNHWMQAEVTSLEVYEVDQFLYTESEDSQRIRMVVSSNPLPQATPTTQTALVSALARKP